MAMVPYFPQLPASIGTSPVPFAGNPAWNLGGGGYAGAPLGFTGGGTQALMAGLGGLGGGSGAAAGASPFTFMGMPYGATTAGVGMGGMGAGAAASPLALGAASASPYTFMGSPMGGAGQAIVSPYAAMGQAMAGGASPAAAAASPSSWASRLAPTASRFWRGSPKAGATGMFSGVGGARAALTGPAMGMFLGGQALGMAGGAIGNGATDTAGSTDRADVGQFMQGAGTAAPLAGAAALALGATGPVGWGVGAGAGVAYGLYKAIWGSDKKESEADKARAMFYGAVSDLARVDPQTAHLLDQQVGQQEKYAKDDPAKLNLYAQGLNYALQNYNIASQRAVMMDDSTALLKAMQTWQGAAAEQNAAKFLETQNVRTAYMEKLAGRLNPTQRDYALWLTQQNDALATNQYNAMRAQAAFRPMQYAMQLQQALNQQYAPVGLASAPQSATDLMAGLMAQSQSQQSGDPQEAAMMQQALAAQSLGQGYSSQYAQG